jgi:TonB-dependent receptor
VNNSIGSIVFAIWSHVIRIGHRFGINALVIPGLSLCLLTPPIMATGIIKGKVFDKETKVGLPGANVVVKGTGVGSAANMDGVFTIYNAPSGEQTVVVSCIGYISATATLNIPDGGTIQHDFYVGATIIEGEAVIITAQGLGQLQAINQQIASNKIVNVVSEAKIQELPDFNAAAAIGRLPGVSTLQSSGEANKIVIRGLAPQYNQIAVGGIRLASTGSTQIGATAIGVTSGTFTNDRSVDLTMVTPYMIKTIEVSKSLTPDMEANAIGGNVNMELREAPSGVHGDVLWQSGYTEKSKKYGNYRGVISLSNRFFDDQLGLYVLGNIEEYDRNADNMNAYYDIADVTKLGANGFHAVVVNRVTLNRHVETRKKYGGNLILDYRLPNGSIKLVNMLSRLNSIYRDYNTTLNYNADINNKSLSLTYREGDGKLDAAVSSLQITNDYGFIAFDLKAANTYSRNFLPYSPYYVFQQNNAVQGFSGKDTNKIPEALLHYVTYGPDSTSFLTSMNLFSSDYKENDQVYKADFKIPFTVGSLLSGSFKIGGQYRYNLITNDQNTPYIQLQGSNNINTMIKDSVSNHWNLTYYLGRLAASNFTSTDSKLYETFLGNKFGSVYWAANPTTLNTLVDFFRANRAAFIDPNDPTGGGWYEGEYQTRPNDYTYIEKYYATYLMSELNFGQNLMMVGGVRFEQTKSEYRVFNMMDNRNPLSQPYFPRTTNPQNKFWLPMLQAKCNVTDWFDIRVSYTQTLARPDYTQLSPHFVIASDQNNVWSGNPNLKPAQAYNHDIFLTFHSNELGLLSVGGFYKEIKNFTFSTSYKLHNKSFYDARGLTGFDSLNTFAPIRPIDGARLYTFVNSRSIAYVRGIETDFQTRLWYLPAPWDGVVLGVNYTHIWSQARYPYYDEVPQGRIVKFIDSSRVARLVFQPNDLLNAYIGYDYGGFSARFSVLFQGNSVTNIAAYPEQDGFSKDYLRFDASAKQKLPWVEGLHLFLEITNLNSRSNMSSQTTIDGFTNQQYYGLVGNLGIRYAL